MANSRVAFGNYLRAMIKQAKMSQAQFYTAVKITKPYFYDILSGKVNPPPPEMQYTMMEKLGLDDAQRLEFLNLAAEGREEIPADIAGIIMNHPDQLDKVRDALKVLFVTQG